MDIRPLEHDPAPGMAAAASRQDFEAWVQTASEQELVVELKKLDEELASPNARSQAAYERHAVDRELARYEQARTIQERREANLSDLRARNAKPLHEEPPGVWVHGIPLDDRERKDLAIFIRWVMSQREGEGR
jgi:hypothetical protein